MSDGNGDHVIDTHALIWHLTQDPKLSSQARAILRDADAGNRRIFVPSIALIEIVYLAERERVAGGLLAHAMSFLEEPGRPYMLCVLDAAVVRATQHVPRDLVPDMPDRIITATALARGLPLITTDGRIHAARVVPVVW